MPLWTRLKVELDRAGQMAQIAIDEGRVRLEAFRARQQADKAAAALGYAVAQARREAREIEADVLKRLSDALDAAETTAAAQEKRLAELVSARKASRRSSTW
ncbi:MAG TPA: hypothetical protein VEI06_14435 [Gemmatimonadaceae bacterium]|nr:hypothetical protein [Gemmatimonadaceae bacterium]